ncbi:MAG: DUF2993 domain-containing protein [Propionicimonas sp.]
MRRVLIWLAVAAVVGVGAFVVDNLVRNQAQDQAEAQIQAQLGSTEGLSVELGGVPFSLALITHTVPSAVLSADAVPLEVDGKQVTLTQVNITTGQVTLTPEELQVASLSGAAVLGYADLETLAGVPVAYAGDQRLELRYAITILGQPVDLAVSALPVLDVPTQVIRLTDPGVEVNGSSFNLPVEQSLIDSLVKPIDVSLDYGLQATAVTPEEAGLSLAFSGTDVVIPLG